jgi:hypothetical protein
VQDEALAGEEPRELGLLLGFDLGDQAADLVATHGVAGAHGVLQVGSQPLEERGHTRNYCSHPPRRPTIEHMFDTYERLAAPFDVTFTDTRGGVELRYITGEQVARRLNEVLGVSGWSFRILRHDINPEADEAWALGELVAEIGERTVVRQQFGSQKIRRSRSTGAPLDLGFDLKGASTDAMKKCASLLGVGLYLSRKEASRPVGKRF